MDDADSLTTGQADDQYFLLQRFGNRCTQTNSPVDLGSQDE
jgi:hypothetical protein